MAEYNDLNRVAIFPVKEKTNEKGPDFTGNLDVAGIKFRISLWKTEAKSGMKYLSGSIQKADEERSAPVKEGADLEDIPF
jgi:uncharacterized protein (DUF736 family)